MNYLGIEQYKYTFVASLFRYIFSRLLIFSCLFFQTTNNLIREIAILELEVMHLEQYLLSLYRKAFDQQTSTHSPPATEQRLKKLVHPQSELLHRPAKPSMPSKRWTASSVSEECEARWKEKLIGPGAHRSQSSLSCRAVDSSRISPSEESLARALHSFHSQPMSFLEASRFKT